MIKIQTNKPVSRFPQYSIFMGIPKIGKSTMMARLPKALILDLEGKGYDDIKCKALFKCPKPKSFFQGVKYFFEKENKEFDFLIIDHIRMLSSFYADRIIDENDVRFVEDVEFGKGQAQLKNDLHKFLRKLKYNLQRDKSKHVIMVAHVTDRNGEIRLDVDGKNETMILGEVDSVGYISRDSEENTTISFQARKGVEFGTRNRYLAGYNGVFEWQKLFKLAKGEKVQ